MPKTNNDKLISAVSKLTDVVEKLEARLAEQSPKKEPVKEEYVPEPIKPIVASQPEAHIPLEYKEIVNTVLNQDFGIAVTPLANMPAFQFEVLVPKEYSNAGENYWATYKEDRRPKVISYSEGTPMVKEWVELVYKNLGPDIQVKVNLNRKRVTAHA